MSRTEQLRVQLAAAIAEEAAELALAAAKEAADPAQVTAAAEALRALRAEQRAAAAGDATVAPEPVAARATVKKVN